MLSLAGVPPLTGFIPKLIIITKLIETNYTVLVFLLLGTYMNLYYYLNISFNILLTRNNINSKHITKETISKPVLIIISTAILGMFPIII
jgi:NADH:ubiquinone oxidoreductase subunit 2 (subunit N)